MWPGTIKTQKLQSASTGRGGGGGGEIRRNKEFEAFVGRPVTVAGCILSKSSNNFIFLGTKMLLCLNVA